MPARLRVLASVAGCAVVLSAGCAGRPASAPATIAAARNAVGMTYGVVAALRPLPQPGRGDVRGAILVALGDDAPAAAAPALVEVIVREDDGRTLSVVQAAAPGLVPAARVAIRHGRKTDLLPLAAGTPPS